MNLRVTFECDSEAMAHRLTAELLECKWEVDKTDTFVTVASDRGTLKQMSGQLADLAQSLERAAK